MNCRVPFFITAVVCLASCSSRTAASDGWYSSYDQAKAAAEANGIPLLIHFHASYCGPCRQMNQQVFSQPEVQHKLQDGIASVEIDVGQHPDIARQYGATTVPRDVVVYPGKAPETINVGFKSMLSYLGLLQEISSKGTRNVIPLKPQAAVVVGLDGFCPVKLLRDKEWISGRNDLTADYRGITYHFSGEAERQTFLKDPAAFAPQNLGCDPIVLYQDQKAVSGHISYGVFFDNKLFLFDTEENRSVFKENPLKYSRIRHAIKVDEFGQRSIN
ncbi:MAG: thioredoxin family protein [Planctomycetaceae bacterium]|nr:thioredoxin family protein [Planctomycetaceae bacterium]